jgi:hypothetical protein
MNRHHPYNASFEHSPGRRGNNSPGPGSDRGHRYQDRGGAPFRGRGGFSRGRGGYGNYDTGMNSHNAYDQGHGDMVPYNNYEPPPSSQQSYYGSNPYADSTPAHFPPPSSAQSGYSQGYSKYEGALQLRLNTDIKIGKEAAEATFVSVYVEVEAPRYWHRILWISSATA